jgi:hypothetical protein
MEAAYRVWRWSLARDSVTIARYLTHGHWAPEHARQSRD